MHGKQLATQNRVTAAALVLLCVGYLAVASRWVYATPIFEAPDELDHTRYVAFLMTHERLPDTRTELDVAGVEATQGPVYYLSASLLLRAAHLPLTDLHPDINPQYGKPHLNLYAPPVTDPNGSLRLLRFVSVGGGLLAVLATYWLARALQLARFNAWLSAACVALLPQFLFISSAISNDSWAAAAGAFVLALIVRLDRRDALQPWQSAALGLCVGLSAITKASLLILIPLCGMMLLRRYRADINRLVAHGLSMGAGFVLGGGWFFARNIAQYGSWLNFATLEVVATNQTIAEESRGIYLLRVLPQMTLRTLIGSFGQVNVFLPDWVYSAAVAALLAAFFGIWYWAWRERRLPSAGWLYAILVIGLNGAAYVLWNITLFSYQGRLLFPTLGALAAMIVRGWDVYSPRVRFALAVAIVVGLLILNGLALGIVSTVYG